MWPGHVKGTKYWGIRDTQDELWIDLNPGRLSGFSRYPRSVILFTDLECCARIATAVNEVLGWESGRVIAARAKRYMSALAVCEDVTPIDYTRHEALLELISDLTEHGRIQPGDPIYMVRYEETNSHGRRSHVACDPTHCPYRRREDELAAEWEARWTP